MAAPFELIFVNASSRPRTVCVYRTHEDLANSDLRSLAWLVEGAAPTTQLAFAWHSDAAFTWAPTGPLAGGTVFQPAQTWPTRPRGNQVAFTCYRGVHRFAAQTRAPDSEDFLILQDDHVLRDAASIGLAIGAAPAFALQAQPRTTVALPAPSLACRITAGDFVQGQVLDLDRLPPSAPLPFTETVRSLTATLRRDLTWRVEVSSP